MSPVAPVGFTVAIQAAAVASNLLAPRLRAGRVRVADLTAVQRRREWPVRIVQAYQQLMQDWMMATRRGDGAGRMPLGYRVQQRIPFLRHLGARIFGLGVGTVRPNPAPTAQTPEVPPLSVRTLVGAALATDDS